jgi:DNA-binding protein HU-beta
VNKAELIDALSAHFEGSKKEATKAVEAVIDTIVRTVVAGEKVAIAGFGNFDKVIRKARTARNPATGATVKVKATAVPKFKPAMQFKEEVSGKRKVAAAVKPAAKKPAAKKAAAKKAAPKKAAKKAAPRKAAKKAAPRKAAKKAAPRKAVKKAAKKR